MKKVLLTAMSFIFTVALFAGAARFEIKGKYTDVKGVEVPIEDLKKKATSEVNGKRFYLPTAAESKVYKFTIERTGRISIGLGAKRKTKVVYESIKANGQDVTVTLGGEEVKFPFTIDNSQKDRPGAYKVTVKGKDTVEFEVCVKDAE